MRTEEEIKEAIERRKKRIEHLEERRREEKGLVSTDMVNLIQYDGNLEALKWMLETETPKEKEDREDFKKYQAEILEKNKVKGRW